MGLFFVRLLNKLGWLQGVNINVTRVVSGTAFLIPMRNKIGYTLLFDKESWMAEVLKRIAPIGGAFVDVGANVGQTLLVAKSIQPNLQYIAFEPNAFCFAYLTELIQVNQLNNVTLLPVAIGGHDGPTTLYHSPGSPDDSSGSIIKEFRDTVGMAQTSVLSLTGNSLRFLLNIRISVIKIDVEGAELEVILNLLEVVQRDRPTIICEILPVYNESNTFRLKRQDELLREVTQLNYVLLRIHTNGALKPINSIGIHDNLNDCNYLFVPKERIAEFAP